MHKEDITFIKLNTIQLKHEIVAARRTRVHSARLCSGGRVFVKFFKQKTVKKNFNTIVASQRELRHPNILQFCGRSPINEPEPFIVYHAMYTQGSAVEHIAATIPTEVTKIFKAGVKLVADLAVHVLLDESYFIFMDGDKAVLSFNTHEISDSEPASPITSSDKGLSMLGELCSQTFNSTNQILYREYLSLDDSITELEPSGTSVGAWSVHSNGDQTHASLHNSGKMPDAPPERPCWEIKWKMSLLSDVTIGSSINAEGIRSMSKKACLIAPADNLMMVLLLLFDAPDVLYGDIATARACPLLAVNADTSRVYMEQISKRIQELEDFEMELAIQYSTADTKEIGSVEIFDKAKYRAFSEDPQAIQEAEQMYELFRLHHESMTFLMNLQRFIRCLYPVFPIVFFVPKTPEQLHHV
ncbi:hypothetical protein ARMGADRAFT_1038416 [Armillaria gallica]|uniref:Protein kinase domain-containing protein n=1 Tax=Armillaria gallica TaxID=47427 RepID=A0A2H3CI84_ARMGA|nr:hypothetical protein ARMGADRAFT_1038416 [Armillaria gallica]